MRRGLFISTLLAVACLLQAHEFWLNTGRFRLKDGETIGIDFRIGENLIGDPWKNAVQRIKSIQLHDKTNAHDLTNQVKDGERENLFVKVTGEGTRLIAFESKESFIKADGEKFNAYLIEEGLEETLEFRKKKNLLNDSASDVYSRHSKMIFQVGAKTDETYRKEVGSIVEIVPVDNPYALKIGDRISFRILFNGKPLFGARIRIQNRHKNRTTVQHIYTSPDGLIETTLSNPGLWMVSFVKMVPAGDKQSEWKSYWASLVFGS